MSKADETRATVLGYFNAWTAKRPEEAFAFLADDLAFWGPTASYTSAEQFRPALLAFAGMTKRAQLHAKHQKYLLDQGGAREFRRRL